MSIKKFSLNLQILLAAGGGVVLGVVLNRMGSQQPVAADVLYGITGTD